MQNVPLEPITSRAPYAISWVCCLGLSVIAGACAHNPTPAARHTAESVADVGRQYQALISTLDPSHPTALTIALRRGHFPDLSMDARQHLDRTLTTLRRRLANIDLSQAPAYWRRIQSILKYRIEARAVKVKCLSLQWVVSPTNGPHLIPSRLLERTYADPHYAARQLIAVYDSFPRFLEQYGAHLMHGVKRGRSSPQIVIRRVVKQLDDMLVQPLNDGPFMKSRLVTSLGKHQLSTSLQKSISGIIYPALLRFRQVLKEEILPNARRSVGLSAMPGGQECYQQIVETMDAGYPSLAAMHRKGLSMVKAAQETRRVLSHQMGRSLGEQAHFMKPITEQGAGSATAKAITQLEKKSVRRLPPYLRHEYDSSFLLGWLGYSAELNSERLGDTSMDGTNTANLRLRDALNLVLDTGIHALRWNRRQAVQFLRTQGDMNRFQATRAVDAAIAEPAALLAPILGKMSLRRLEKHAQAVLGDGFDTQAFHRQVLKYGAIPLPSLGEQIRWWLGRKEMFIAQ